MFPVNEDVQQLMIPYEGEFRAHKVYRVTEAKVDTKRPYIQNAILISSFP